MRGWRESTFQPSSSKALQSASEICIGLSQMTIDDGNLEHVRRASAPMHEAF